MKNSDKILIALIFIALNLGALYLISTYFNVGYGVLFTGFVVLVASVDMGRRIQNYKILKQQRKLQKANEEMKRKQNQNQRQIDALKKQEAVQRQNQRNRMREHYNYVNKNKKK